MNIKNQSMLFIKIIGPFLYESLRGEMEEMENKNEIELEVNNFFLDIYGMGL